jgi:hypothetical protein
MPLSQIIPVGFIIAGFLFAGAISERSLRGVDESIQGRLLNGLSSLRKLHLVAIPALILCVYFFPASFWPSITVYFGIGTLAAIFKLRKLDLPVKLQRWQAASVASIFIAMIFGWISSWLL